MGDQPLMGLRAWATPDPSTTLVSWLPGPWPLSSFLVSVEGNILQGHPTFIIAKHIWGPGSVLGTWRWEIDTAF